MNARVRAKTTTTRHYTTEHKHTYENIRKQGKSTQQQAVKATIIYNMKKRKKNTDKIKIRAKEQKRIMNGYYWVQVEKKDNM